MKIHIIVILLLLTATGAVLAQTPVVINEVNTGGPDFVEICNIGASPADVSGWYLRIGEGPAGTFDITFQFPGLPGSGTVMLASLECVIVHDGAVPPVTPPGTQTFVSVLNIPWNANQDGTCLLADDLGNGKDYVAFGEPNAFTAPFELATLLGLPGAPARMTAWNGVGTPGAANTENVFQRTSVFDNDSAVDWVMSAAGTETPGALSAGQLPPFYSFVDFELQGPVCTNAFPSPKGAAGDPDGVSWNGDLDGAAFVDNGPNGVGFPTSGQQYLRIVASGPESFGAGVVPSVLTQAEEVYIEIPVGACEVTLDWDFYNVETGPSSFNDGMLIDFIDEKCEQKGVVAFADTFTSLGAGFDSGGTCPSFAADVNPGGASGVPQNVSAVIPSNSRYLRVACWNGGDTSIDSHAVVDNIIFTNATGQVQGFEGFGPACSNTVFPSGPLGWNGIGTATVDIDNGCGMPTAGAQYLRINGSGQFDHLSGVAPSLIPANVNTVTISVPGPGNDVSFAWDFYDGEFDSQTFNDAGMVDVLDVWGNQLAVLAFAEVIDSNAPGGCTDNASVCSSFGAELAPDGPQDVVRRRLPVGAVTIRFSCWNHGDNSLFPALLIDSLSFCQASAPEFPGTEAIALGGDDITGATRKNFEPQPDQLHCFDIGDTWGVQFWSPNGSLVGLPFIILAEVYSCSAGAPPPAFPGLNVSGGPGTTLLVGGNAVPPLGSPLALPPFPGVVYDTGPLPPPLFGIDLCINTQGIVLFGATAANGIFSSSNSQRSQF